METKLKAFLIFGILCCIQVSMASHLMGFMAGESRLKGTIEEVNL